jgi:outer membrane protein TolC
MRVSALTTSAVLLALTAALPASAQPAPAPPPVAPALPAVSKDAKDANAKVDTLAAALTPTPGGLSPDQVGKTAAKTRHSVRAKRAELEAAAARVDQAMVNFAPRLSVSATYTRLSTVNNSLGSGALVGVSTPGPVLVDPTGAKCGGKPCVVDAAGNPAGAVTLSFPALTNSWSIVASIAVPVSDYVLRISQGYAAAQHAEKSKRFETQAEELQVSADAKLAFYNWVRTKGQVVVAKDAVEQAKAHTADAKKIYEVGLASKADVLRLEAQVANAEQLQAEADAQASVTTEQLRIVLGLKPTDPIELGVDVMHEAATPPAETLAALQDQAVDNRLELKALDGAVAATKEQESIAKAGLFPRLDAFADLQYANPNQRIFPSKDQWDATWDLGLRLSYTFNDTFTAIGAGAEAKARALSISEQKGQLKEGIRLEVASAYADVKKAAVSIEAAERGLAASEESLRVRRELFKNGKATAVDLVDAETDFTRSELGRLNARIGLLAARVRLDHAVGRDVAKSTASD